MYEAITKRTLIRRQTTSHKMAWVIPPLLVFFVFLAYSNTFGVPFIFDDIPSIVENESIKNIKNIRAVLLPEIGGGVTAAGRPMVNLSLAINHAISGGNVWSYHVVNLIIHVCSGLLLYGLTRRTLFLTSPLKSNNETILFCAALSALWLLHPIQTESVTYIVQRAESLCGLFFLLTFYSFIRGLEDETTQSWGWLSISVIACLLGMASKEVMVSAPLLVLLFDRAYAAGTFRRAFKLRWIYYMALGLTWAAAAWCILRTGGRGGTAGIQSVSDSWFYLLTQCKAIIHYLRLCAYPSDLVLDYGVVGVHSWTQVWWQGGILLCAFAITLWALVRKPKLGFLGAGFFAVLAPSSSILPIYSQTMAEHRMYLALVFVLMAVLLTAYQILGVKSLYMALFLAIGGSVFTHSRNRVYQSSLTIWGDVVAKAPENARGHNKYGFYLFSDKGDLDGAYAEYNKAIQLEPRYAEAYYNMGVLQETRGRYAEASDCYTRAIALQVRYPEAYNNLGNVLGKLGEHDKAMRHFKEALRQNAGYAEVYNNIGTDLSAQKRYAEAADWYEKAVSLKPGYALAWYNWGNVLCCLDRYADAVAHYKKAIVAKGDFYEAYNNLGNALQMMNRYADAIVYFEKAVSINKNFAEAQCNWGNALAQLNRPEEALSHYRECLKIEPNYVQAANNLGGVLLELGRMEEAEKAYEAVLRIASDLLEAKFGLAHIYTKTGRINEALALYRDIQRVLPGDRDLSSEILRLQLMQNNFFGPSHSR